MECGADADRDQNAIFLGVHGVKSGLIVIIKSYAMQQTVQGVQQEFTLNGQAAFLRPACGDIDADGDVHIDRFAWFGKLERQNVRRAGLICMARGQLGHTIVIDKQQADSRHGAMSVQSGLDEPIAHPGGVDTRTHRWIGIDLHDDVGVVGVARGVRVSGVRFARFRRDVGV